MLVFRLEVVECLLSGGIPLSKVDTFRPILEKYGYKLNSSTNFRELIPAVLEKEKVKNELKNEKKAAVISDGTARQGEALAIISSICTRKLQAYTALPTPGSTCKGNEGK